jgi:hypothetical protein
VALQVGELPIGKAQHAFTVTGAPKIKEYGTNFIECHQTANKHGITAAD